MFSDLPAVHLGATTQTPTPRARTKVREKVPKATAKERKVAKGTARERLAVENASTEYILALAEWVYDC